MGARFRFPNFCAPRVLSFLPRPPRCPSLSRASDDAAFRPGSPRARVTMRRCLARQWGSALRRPPARNVGWLLARAASFGKGRELGEGGTGPVPLH